MTMTVHAATADQLERLRELVDRKLAPHLAEVFHRQLENDIMSFEQADHIIADLSALPNHRGAHRA